MTVKCKCNFDSHKQNHYFIHWFCTGYYGYEDRYDWQRYLTLVYVHNKGYVAKFDYDKSLGKFRERFSTLEAKKQLSEMYMRLRRNPTNEEVELLCKLDTECDKWMKEEPKRICYYNH